jgi:hypothetical protein
VQRLRNAVEVLERDKLQAKETFISRNTTEEQVGAIAERHLELQAIYKEVDNQLQHQKKNFNEKQVRLSRLKSDVCEKKGLCAMYVANILFCNIA